MTSPLRLAISMSRAPTAGSKGASGQAGLSASKALPYLLQSSERLAPTGYGLAWLLLGNDI
ncbi:hypothetical protein JMX53_03140 [Cutibacterium avidum]|uniref:hypothetical protein n=1 Tax=Cutibacterium avidum TaxID=33010 RepID=UPI00192B408D|nr:hypothetical protein [Cutibacterium avidum]QQY15574.1 hypothetical protein JMX53_03140 [Cutibacterium avidum]